MKFGPVHTENQCLVWTPNAQVEVWMKREDLIHPVVSGNKFRKLKYNFKEAKAHSFSGVLTFGGAFSNHITAVAYAAKILGMRSVGVIRGEELGKNLPKTLQQNATLKFAHDCGMELQFITREEYRHKDSEQFNLNLQQKFPGFYFIPEGGSNTLAVKGCEEILTAADANFDVICSPVGTGGTIAGIINSSGRHQQILGFPALKGDFLKPEIAKFTTAANWELITDYHFGGYAKINRTLVNFINDFRKKNEILLDPIYTGKMMFGIFDLLNHGYFQENTRILAVHTGGLQGIAGINNILKKKKLPLIEE